MFPIRDHNPSERIPFVTFALLAANIAIFVVGLTVFNEPRDEAKLLWHYALIPARLMEGENAMALITSQFLHGGVMHLLGNMLFLWIFGDNLEDEMGHLGFIVFYLACGVAAGLAQVAADPSSQIPMVGASGAIAGVMGGYLLLFPKARVDVLLFIVIFARIFSVPAWIMLGIWFAFQIGAGLGADTSQGGVAYWAHAGGFVLGMILTIPVFVRRGAQSYWRRTSGRPPHPEARYKLTQSHVPIVRRRK